jgi:GT2 family glycosyltransferase
MQNSRNVDISVVIPCRNGAGSLAQQLEAILGQRTDALFEVVVADNGSTDRTADLVRSFMARDGRLRLIDASRALGANVGRNDGVRAAGGRFILLTDADDVVGDGWIHAHWQAFQNGAQSVGGGLNRVLGTGEVLSRETRLYRPLAGGGVTFANATNCGFTAAAFHDVGGFDESFVGGADEVEFFWRMADAGYRLELVPDAVVDKLAHSHLDDAFRQYFHYGRGEARLLQKHRPRLLAPATVVATCQAVAWGVLRATVAKSTRGSRRRATCTLAWNLGLLSESTRLRSEPRRSLDAGSALALPD